MKSQIFSIAKQEGLKTNDIIKIFEESMNINEIAEAVSKAEDRLFFAWSTIETRDEDEEKIRIQDAIRAQEVLLKRGGALTDMHTNKVIGKTLAYKVLLNEDEGKLGIMQLNQIYDDMPADDSVWKDIKSGKKRGLSVGGQFVYPSFESDTDGELVKVLEGFMQYETGVVDDPAHQAALVEAFSLVAKSKKPYETQKPFAGFKNFEDCVSQNKDKKDPEAFCATIMREVEGKEKNKNYLNNRDFKIDNKKETDTDSELDNNKKQSKKGEINMTNNENLNSEDLKKREDRTEELEEENKKLKATIKEMSEKLKKGNGEEEEPKKPKEEDKKKSEEPAGEEPAKEETPEAKPEGDEKKEEEKKEGETDSDKIKKMQEEIKKLKSKVTAVSKVSTPTPDNQEHVAKQTPDSIKKQAEESLGYKIATGQVKKTMGQLHEEISEAKNKNIQKVLDSLQ